MQVKVQYTFSPTNGPVQYHDNARNDVPKDFKILK